MGAAEEWQAAMSECDNEVCWPSVEHIQPEQCEKNAAILFVSIELLHCGSVNRGEVSGKKKKSFHSEDKKQDKVPVGLKNGFDLTAQCKCHMTPSTCKPVYYIGHNITITLRRITPEKTRRPVFIISRHVDIVRNVFSDFWNYIPDLESNSSGSCLCLPLLSLSFTTSQELAGEIHQVCASTNKCKLTFTYCLMYLGL